MQSFGSKNIISLILNSIKNREYTLQIIDVRHLTDLILSQVSLRSSMFYDQESENDSAISCMHIYLYHLSFLLYCFLLSRDMLSLKGRSCDVFLSRDMLSLKGMSCDVFLSLDNVRIVALLIVVAFASFSFLSFQIKKHHR